jgi:glycosyltransferase involved in cell wall biosynthesis
MSDRPAESAAQGSEVDISVCIPTYNRAELLQLTLATLNAVRNDRRMRVEVIVVDNNSSDHTRRVVEQAATRAVFPTRYLFEPRQGVSNARNCAIQASAGAYLGFLDDESLVAEDWLNVAADTIAAHRPAFVGGPYKAHFPPDLQRPRWFKPEYGDAYYLHRDYTSGYRDGFRASGCNMLVRRDIFAKVGFHAGLGMKGDAPGAAEEPALQDAYLKLHPSEGVFYAAGLMVHQVAMREKMSLLYKLRREIATGRSWIVRGNDPDYPWLIVPRLLGCLLVLLLSPIGALVRSRRKYPYWQNFYYEAILPKYLNEASLIVAAIGRSLRFGQS